MTGLKLNILIGLMSSLLATNAIADTTTNPLSIRIEGGLTGFGGAVIYDVNPYVSLALGYNGGQVNWRNNVKINGLKYDIKMNNNMPYVNAIIRPWGTSDSDWLRSVYTSVGVGYNNDHYDIERKFSSGEKIYKKYSASQDILVKGRLESTTNISPYIGLGIASELNKHWGFFSEIGVYYLGDLSVKITDIQDERLNKHTQIAAHEIKGQLDDESFLRWNPVVKIGVTYSF